MAQDSQNEKAPSKVTRRQALRYYHDSQKLWKRARKKVSSNVNEELEAAFSALHADLEDKDNYQASYDALYEKVERYLAFARKSNAREIIESLLIALVVALVLRTFLIEPFKIPSRSMVPTLLEGDQLFVSKLSYGVRLPFMTKNIIQFSSPERGDVVVFVFPRDEAAEYLIRNGQKCMQLESLAEDKDYIKRVIGIEGDVVEVIDQIVHVNGEPIERVPLYERETDLFFLDDKHVETWNQEHHGNATYTTITHDLPSSHFGPIKVQPGHFFVMGDNRDNSSDGRCWGQVPVENLKGRALFIWWSSGAQGPRWHRMFTPIH